MSDLNTNRQSRRARVMASLYDYSTSIAESKAGSNRGLAAGTAASFLALGLEQMEKKNRESLEHDYEFTEAEVEAVQNMALSAEEYQKSKEKFHFMDRFMEKMVQHTMNEGSADAEELSQRLHDPSRSKKAPLSLILLTSNMKRLSAKMGVVFKVQYGLVHILTWKRPTKTLCVLVFYTAVCLWPHLVVALPLLVLLFGIILPAYIHRHPMDTPELIKVPRRGQSFLDFLNESNDRSVIMDMIDEPMSEEDSLSQTYSTSSGSFHATKKPQSPSSIALQTLDVAEEVQTSEKAKIVKKNVSLLMNMRDLQNLTTDLLNSIDQGEKMSTDLVGFKDERLTTYIFYVLIAVTSVVLFFGKYIPWRMIFILSGWVFMLLCHPKAKKYLVTLSNNNKKGKPVAEVTEEDADSEEEVGDKKLKLPFESFDRHDIIVDDKPEVRVVEIYELQRRDLFKHEWNLYAYTKRLFDFKDTVRVSGKLPHGVDALTKVHPPPEWKYDFGYASNWRIDQKPLEFLLARGIDQEHLSCRDDTEGWIYDDLPVDQDYTAEFRRRRLFRECYRYSRPPRKVTL
ncbi:CIC11C00000002130 [Sungouiella intermedia]|uniref:CIC11C00000002130 n=1 Tax=Sungouiella intermedia TaxID=45354 RepID=A0A1L0D7J1_9ASCO|nr:CIC11C00000002130 [[Candida] intermedia]